MLDFNFSGALIAFNPFSALWEGIKQVLGWIMNVIYLFLDLFMNQGMIGWSIILFTIIIYTLLIPLTIKQQRSLKLNSVVQPEINAITKKYKNKKDNESMIKQNEEMQAVYKKYGTSPTGGCLVSFLQLPIMLALYRVLYNIPKYVAGVRNIYNELIDGIMKTSNHDQIINDLVSSQAHLRTLAYQAEGLSKSQVATEMREIFYNFRSADWGLLAEKFPKLTNVIDSTHQTMDKVNSFAFGTLNIANPPSQTISEAASNGKWLIVVMAALIPILAGVFSWLSMKVGNDNSSAVNDSENPMASSLKMTTAIMPLISVFFCYSLPIGIGLYWIASSLYRIVSQYFISKKMSKVDVNDIVKENLEKYNKKLEKKGLPPQNIKNIATASVKNTGMDQKRREERDKSIQASTEYYNQSSGSAKPGSLKAKANMVQQYNEKHKK